MLVVTDSSPPSRGDLALSVLLIKVYHQSSGECEITFAVFSLSAYDSFNSTVEIVILLKRLNTLSLHVL